MRPSPVASTVTPGRSELLAGDPPMQGRPDRGRCKCSRHKARSARQTDPWLASLGLRAEQFVQMLIELADRIGIGTEKRKVAIDGLNRPEFGIGN
jgi:hypothetical protein